MKKTLLTAIIVLFTSAMATFMLLNGCIQADNGPTVIIGKAKVQVELADTPAKRRVGLMERRHMDKNKGMLFVFEQVEKPVFWMKDCYIPLDIMFINNNRIVQFYESVPPCKEDPCPLYPCVENVDKALEVNAGFIRKHNIKIGDTIKFAGFRNIP